MKRMIKAGWYVGEPSSYGKSKGGKTHSYYSNPDDWEDKQYYTLEFIDEVYNNNEGVDQVFWPNPSKTPWIVQVQSKVNKGDYFKFDLWEDAQTLDEQKEDFLDWVEDQLMQL